jgi:predicted 2-oxoglutarate/Fe(II)-dependent dioxygenase YbiX
MPAAEELCEASIHQVCRVAKGRRSAIFISLRAVRNDGADPGVREWISAIS